MNAESPNEFILQRIWLEQRLRRNQLRTLDGRSVVVLHPGFWNREPGPDFRNAIVQFNDNPPVTGDVEIDVDKRGWHEHGHDLDPAYRKVILHVVWDETNHGTARSSGLATLTLRTALDAPLAEIIQHYTTGPTNLLPPQIEPGACSAPLKQLNQTQTTELILNAAKRRLAAKANAIQARARHTGWNQALWEGLFAGLGYKHNVWPMRRLAELLPVIPPPTSDPKSAILSWQSRLLGLSGLLPTDFSRLAGETRTYVRKLWDEWWRHQAELAVHILPASLWCLRGLRPANQPVRRLALAARWLAVPDFIDRLDSWLTQQIPDRHLVQSLHHLLASDADEFWAHHWTFASKRSAKTHPLIGAPRVTDLAMNVILPWFLSRAQAGQNPEISKAIEHRYFAWPAGEDNAVLRFVRQRLLGAAKLALPRTAAIQQGLMQLARDYCDQSNLLCEECELPDLLHSMTTKAAQGNP